MPPDRGGESAFAGQADTDQLSPIDLNLSVHALIHRRRSCLSPVMPVVNNRLYIGDDLS